MSQEQPLGRIHPHGHSGKSVYQLAAAGKEFIGIGFTVCLGLVVAFIGVISLVAGIASGADDFNVLAVVIGIIVLGLREAGLDLGDLWDALTETRHSHVSVAETPVQKDPDAPLPDCDKDLLEDMRQFAARMQYAAKLSKWIEVLAYASFLDQMTVSGPWAPYFQSHHPQRPKESVLAAGVRDDHQTLLNQCRAIQRYALRNISQPELDMIEGLKAAYYPGTGELEYADSTRNGQTVTV